MKVTEIKEDSIEKVLCEPFKKLQTQDMDEEITKMLMTLILGDNKYKIPDKEKPFLFQLIESRIESCFNYKIEDHKLLLFLTIVSKNPGNAVMYLWYLQYYCKNRKINKLDLMMFCHIFPMGFPSERDLLKLWDSQKVTNDLPRDSEDYNSYTDNLVDCDKAGLSLKF